MSLTVTLIISSFNRPQPSSRVTPPGNSIQHPTTVIKTEFSLNMGLLNLSSCICQLQSNSYNQPARVAIVPDVGVKPSSLITILHLI